MAMLSEAAVNVVHEGVHEALAGVTISTTYYLLLATCYLAGVDAGDGQYHKITHRE